MTLGKFSASRQRDVAGYPGADWLELERASCSAGASFTYPRRAQRTIPGNAARPRVICALGSLSELYPLIRPLR